MIGWFKSRRALRDENRRLLAQLQAAEPTVYDRLGGGSSSYSTMFGLGTDDSDVSELVKHYRLWNYVAISRICFKVAEQFPYVSRVIDAEAGQPSELTMNQRRHIRQSCGSIMQTHQDLEPVHESHPLLRLLHEVNPEDWWGTFVYETVMFWQLTGQFYWWVIDNRAGLPSEMWVLPTQWVEQKWSREGELIGYEVTPDGDVRRRALIPPEQIISGKHKSPLGKSQAQSPTAAGSEWIDNAESVEKARWMTFQNGPLPSVSIELDPEQYAKPDPEVLRAVKDRFVARYGGTARAGEPIIAPPGMTVKPFSMKPAEMDFPDTMEQVRDQVLALHGVPKVIAGITTDVNRATIYGANLIFCENTVNPLLSLLSGIMTEKLSPRFGKGLRIWFDDARPDDAEAEREETRLDWALGAITPNERRSERGREPLEGTLANSTFTALGVQPIGGVDFDEPDEPEEPVEVDEIELPEEAAWEFNRGGDGNGEANGSRDALDDRRRGQGANGRAGRQEEIEIATASAERGDPQRVAPVPRQVRGGAILTPRAVWQRRRISRLLRAWELLRYEQERMMMPRIERYFGRLAAKVKQRVRGMMGDSGLFISDLLFEASDEQMWAEEMAPAYLISLISGATFEMEQLNIEMPKPEDLVAASLSWVKQDAKSDADRIGVEPDRTEFFERYPGLPAIFVEMPPQVQADVIGYLERRQIESWKGITGTTRRKVEDLISKGLAEGWDGRTMVREIERLIDRGAYHGQATAIARTESTAAMNFSEQSVRSANGIPDKMWISTLDADTRPGSGRGRWNHRAPNGMTVPNSTAFLVSGEMMMHPGDMENGSAGNVVNCRCMASGVVSLT